MRSYVPNTEGERKEMLSSMGLSSMDELFRDIPDELKLSRPLNLPEGKSETEIRRIFRAYAERTNGSMPLFRGAGAYRHYIPSLIPQLLMRSEFYTAYTPYQAEMSQGMLQAIFEYQTLMCRLTGMDVSNASVYDGATAAAEAMLMLRDAKRKQKILISDGLNPDVIAVIHTYARFARLECVSIPLNSDGTTDMDALSANSDGAAGYIVANPNFFGCLENMDEISAAVHGFGGLLVSYVNPISLSLVKRPGDYGADIAVGDAQPLGLPLSFGGPYCGFMCSTQKLIRNLPGRIAGQTSDAEGNRVFVLTLQAREQHIRREKASSNICSNQMLCAITASMYLSVMGPEGMREVAMQNLQKAHYLRDGIKSINGARIRYENTPFFNEFVVEFDKDSAVINALLKKKGIVGGARLANYKDGDNGILMCVTEMNTREEIDALITALEEITK